MGNVIATSVPQPSMPGAVPPPNLPDQPPGISKIASEFSSDKNPGNMEDLHKKCKDVFPQTFEGAKVMINKALSNHFQISHTLNMSPVGSGYRFGATYVGTNQISPMEAFPILLGDMDPSGNMNANIIHQYKNIRAKFAAQIQDNRYAVTQLTADLKGLDYTASVTLGNTDILNGSGVTVLHYLQNVAPSLALGAEMAYQYGPQVPGGEIAVMSLAGRYTGKDYVVSGTLGAAALHACYYRKGSESVQVGVEVETNLRLGESVCSLGYQIDLPKGNVVFRGMVDTNWSVGAVLEKKLAPLPFTLALSGMINHTKGLSKFGIGLIIG